MKTLIASIATFLLILSLLTMFIFYRECNRIINDRSCKGYVKKCFIDYFKHGKRLNKYNNECYYAFNHYNDLILINESIQSISTKNCPPRIKNLISESSILIKNTAGKVKRANDLFCTNTDKSCSCTHVEIEGYIAVNRELMNLLPKVDTNLIELYNYAVD